MTGIVVVSHSRALAEAAVELARALLTGLDVRVEVAAGAPDGGFGTDPVAVMDAVQHVDDGDGVLVLTDLGSAVMSAETALEMLDPTLAGRVRLSTAPLVEGLVGAYSAAGLGKDLAAVAVEADAAVVVKPAQMGL